MARCLRATCGSAVAHTHATIIVIIIVVSHASQFSSHFHVFPLRLFQASAITNNRRSDTDLLSGKQENPEIDTHTKNKQFRVPKSFRPNLWRFEFGIWMFRLGFCVCVSVWRERHHIKRNKMKTNTAQPSSRAIKINLHYSHNEMFRDLFDVQVSNCIEWDFQSVSGLSCFSFCMANAPASRGCALRIWRKSRT